MLLLRLTVTKGVTPQCNAVMADVSVYQLKIRPKLVCVWWKERKERHSLFISLLPLDICASVVIRQQILRDRVWQVHQYASQQGCSLFAPLLFTFGLQLATL